VAQLIREGKKFAVLIAVDLLPQIKVTKTKENDKMVEQCLSSMPTILIAPLALVWLVNHPDYQLPKQGHVVLYGTHDRAPVESSKENGNNGSDVEPIKNPTIPLVRFLRRRSLIGQTKTFQISRSMIGCEQSLMA
jgi:hypothetical protein